MKQCKLYFFLIFLFVISGVFASIATAEKVVYVIDGDTVILDNRERVRLIGIDTPEIRSKYHRGERYGKEAKEYLKERIEGKDVVLKKGKEPRDKYGRVLAYIYLPDGTFINEELVRKGYAETYRKFPFKYRDQFLELEAAAKENHRGMWGKRKRPWWMRGFGKKSKNEK